MTTKLPTLYQEFIHLSRYARWIEEEKRRETWEETVDRYVNHMCDVQCKGMVPDDIKQEIREGILTLKVMPSMRCMMTAGEALERDQVAGYNCSYIAIDDPKAFDEVLYILMCGTGVGFSVERQFVNKMPVVAERLRPSKTVIGVEDSKIGWANAYRELISMLYQGRIPTWDVSAVRKAGERLKTFGGRSSGPAPLEDLFNFTIDIFKDAQGRKLSSIECHDLCCKIGEIVVVGGVRRSALISLSNPSDDRMRHAKSGSWWENTPWRALANNSACYTEKPGMETFMREWLSLMESKSGERGFFNREAVVKWAEKFERRDSNHEFGCNPCSEIVLRSCGLCNLSEVVVRAEDDIEDLKHKVKLATIIGTMQATLTGFRYLRDKWRENAEDEALLGVSLTGIMDNKLMAGGDGKKKLVETLTTLRDYVVEVNKEYAELFGIKQAAATTCVKPSGTVSQLVDCASGIHARYSPYYIRRVRADVKDPLATLMKELGFPCEPDVMKPESNLVFSFPVKSPDNALVTEEVPSLDHLDLWKTYQLHWCEHKPSITIHLREQEWMEAGAWVYKNFDIVSGISFLPYSGHSYQQAPYEEVLEDAYIELLGNMPEHIDWTRLSDYEKEDQTVGAKTYACSGDSCEVVDLTKD
jgi:ribonucleoside-diphosphate reductase alpha chain